MKKNWLKLLWIFAALACACPARGQEETAAPEGKVSGFTFVVPDKNGGQQSIVRGDTANFLENGLIEIINVKTQVFRPGESDVFITSPKGRFNKMTREVTTDEPVQIQTQEMLITGTGLQWNPGSNKAELKKNVTVKIFSKPKGMNL